MRNEHYEDLADRDLDYWWFRVRATWVMAAVRRVAPEGVGLLVDIGCGAGGFLAAALREGLAPRDHLLGLEPHSVALEAARRRGLPVRPVAGDDWSRLNVDRPPDVITLLDVLEHVAEPVAALDGLRRAVAPGAHVIVLVPALQMLWSLWDDLLGHQRRYDRPLLRRHLQEAGWEVLEMRYLFNLLVLPALARGRLIGSHRMPETEFPEVSPRMNEFLTRVFRAETRLPALPFGTSLAAVARRRS